ncbi:Zinc finger domain-containing protein [Giardia muris]|uniref:Zinc finger domain-containing protein n=1 Tax=Giardia muris TaxID=5742 RepID=A0A4Z1SWB5_GIAMU|nr:Zinc finger domain-containing protein [Giardia muris]|eukprot:TNJ30064.1 Zinc finger domain-containing protein [Giardia muris]
MEPKVVIAPVSLHCWRAPARPRPSTCSNSNEWIRELRVAIKGSREEPELKAGSQPQQGVCRDFYRTGYCPFGSACIYLHVRPEDL